MANFEPLPFRRQFGGNVTETAQCSSKPMEESPFIDVSGATVSRPVVTGACRKCGYVGHLAYQCRNFLQPKDSTNAVLDVSSTSSASESDTPLVSKDEKRRDQKKHKKEHRRRKRKSRDKTHKHEKKRKRRRSNSTEFRPKQKSVHKSYHSRSSSSNRNRSTS